MALKKLLSSLYMVVEPKFYSGRRILIPDSIPSINFKIEDSKDPVKPLARYNICSGDCTYHFDQKPSLKYQVTHCT